MIQTRATKGHHLDPNHISKKLDYLGPGILIFWLIIWAPASLLAEVVSHVSTNCAGWTETEWDKNIESLLSTEIMKPMQICGYLEIWKKNCPSDFKKRLNCLKRIGGYFRPLCMGEEKRRNFNFSALVTDEDYLKSIPPAAKDPPTVLGLRPLPPKWKELAIENKWKWALFPSNTGNSNRLVIFAPGEKYDKYLLYFTDSDTNKDPTQFERLQMQAVEKTSAGTPPKYFFQAWDLFPDDDGLPTTTGGRCVQCHVSGPRAIVPRKEADLRTEVGGVRDLKEFNSLIVRNGPLDYSLYFDEKYFPSKMNLGEKHRCNACHDGDTRQSLAHSHGPQGFYLGNFDRVVVLESRMPPRPRKALTPNDRHQIVADIENEFFTKLDGWLREVRCEQARRSPSAERSAGKPGDRTRGN